MKTLKLVIIIFCITALLGCKKKDNSLNEKTIKAEKNIVLAENKGGMEMYNKSDIAFNEALTSYKNKEYKKAGDLLATGAKELSVEAKTKGSIFNDELNTSIKHLTEIAKEIQNGEKVDESALRTMIANGEINVNHGYLTSDDIFVLTEPEKVNEYRFSNRLDHNLKFLEVGTSKLEGEAQKEAKKLEIEGRKLKEELRTWNNNAESHANKSKEHFKKYQPDYD